MKKLLIVMIFVLSFSYGCFWETADHTNVYDPATKNSAPTGVVFDYTSAATIEKDSIAFEWQTSPDNDFKEYRLYASTVSGFVPVENYGSNMAAYDSEIGKCEDCRYLYSTIFTPWADAGGVGATMLATTNAAAHVDVYPFLYLAMDAFGIVPLKGKASITPTIINPTPSKSDPLGQKGIAGWKSMQTCVILNDLFMVRLEAACKINP